MTIMTNDTIRDVRCSELQLMYCGLVQTLIEMHGDKKIIYIVVLWYTVPARALNQIVK